MATTSFVRSQEPGPARATIILGVASFGAVLGFILAFVIGLEFLGFELPDAASGLSTVALVGAGWGWAIGALLGDLTSSGARPIQASTRRGLRIAALVAVVLGVAVVFGEARLVAPNGLLAAELPWIRAATAADAIAGSATLLSASRAHQPASGHRPSPWIGWAAGAGFVCAVVLLFWLVVSVASVVFSGLGEY
jgi:hypothetical protein